MIGSEAQLERNSVLLKALAPSYTKLRGYMMMMSKLLNDSQMEIMSVDDAITKHEKTYKSMEELRDIFGLKDNQDLE